MRPVDQGFSGAGVPAWIGPYDAVLIGASFGGPKAIEAILAALPADFPAPIVVCQHITPGHTEQWAQRLGNHSKLIVTEAVNNERMQPGHVYIAPAGRHLRFIRLDGHYRIRLDADLSDSLHVPSIDAMFTSAAKAIGARVLAVLLTGMGTDGAQGLLALRRTGAYTLAESEESAQSYSMPGAAVSLGAVTEELPLDALAKRVAELGSAR